MVIKYDLGNTLLLLLRFFKLPHLLLVILQSTRTGKLPDIQSHSKQTWRKLQANMVSKPYELYTEWRII